MTDGPPPDAAEEASDDTWYVYDRHLNLLQVTATLARAEAWAIEHWEVVEIADREEVDVNDYWYLLLAAPDATGYASRDYQARITRRDRSHRHGVGPRCHAALP